MCLLQSRLSRDNKWFFPPVFICAPGGNRTPVNGSEDHCVIRYTTGAKNKIPNFNFQILIIFFEFVTCNLEFLLSAPSRIRTCDRLLKRQLLYRLSYKGLFNFIYKDLGPATFCLRSRRVGTT